MFTGVDIYIFVSFNPPLFVHCENLYESIDLLKVPGMILIASNQLELVLLGKIKFIPISKLFFLPTFRRAAVREAGVTVAQLSASLNTYEHQGTIVQKAFREAFN